VACIPKSAIVRDMNMVIFTLAMAFFFLGREGSEFINNASAMASLQPPAIPRNST